MTIDSFIAVKAITSDSDFIRKDLFSESEPRPALFICTGHCDAGFAHFPSVSVCHSSLVLASSPDFSRI